MISYIIHVLFVSYITLLLLRILMSWVPRLRQYKFSHFVFFYTEPYLKIFRKIIPPIGGLDVSTIVAFIFLNILEQIIVRMVS
ncbi:MAG: YggT family protein [Chlamydiota bacterium]